jgi:hypothetical protein
MLVAVFVVKVSWLWGEDDPVSGPVLHLEAVVLVDKLPDKLRGHVVTRSDASTMYLQLQKDRSTLPANRVALTGFCKTIASTTARLLEPQKRLIKSLYNILNFRGVSGIQESQTV